VETVYLFESRLLVPHADFNDDPVLIFKAMKKTTWLFLIFFAFSMAACDDDAPDAAAPVVAITSPVANASFLVVDEVELRANVTDNTDVKHVRVFLIDPIGNRNQVDEVNIDFRSINKTGNLNVDFTLPEGSATGAYTMIVEAEDKQQNVAESSVIFAVHSPDLDEAGLNTALADKPPFRKWISYNGSYLEEFIFEKSFFHIIDTDGNLYVEENELNQFALDFDIEKEIHDKMVLAIGFDGLGPVALNIGLRDAKLFTDWDLNRNGQLTAKEFTGGVFSRWDDNGDDVLSREEYERRIYNYFIP
jgi:hypothetical protein